MSAHKYLVYIGFAFTNLGFMLHHETMMYRITFGLAAVLFCAWAIKTLNEDKEEYNNE